MRPSSATNIGGGAFGPPMAPVYQRNGGGSGNFQPPKTSDVSSAAIVAQMAETQDVAVEARRSLAYLATLCLLCIYAAPTVISLHLAVDPDSAFWIGRYGYFALCAPLTIILVHLVHIAHLTAGGRSQLPFVIATLAPLLVFVLVGSVYMVGARDLNLGAFESLDACSGPDAPPKLMKLEMAYARGVAALDECAKRDAVGLRRPTLDVCQEWTGEPPVIVKNGNKYTVYNRGKLGRLFATSTKLRQNFGRELKYLATTEANHACSSFCKRGQMLWHMPGTVVGFEGEPCAPFVALKLQGLWSAGSVVLWSGIIGGAVFLGLLVAAGRLLTRAGYT